MPIKQTKFIFCNSCGKVIETVFHGDLLNPKNIKLLFRKSKKYCKECKRKA